MQIHGARFVGELLRVGVKDGVGELVCRTVVHRHEEVPRLDRLCHEGRRRDMAASRLLTACLRDCRE